MKLLGAMAIFCVLVIVASGCQKSETITKPELPTKCEYAPGNRDFTWRMDTVAWFPSKLGGVWAFSDSDAYLMGYIITNDNPSQLLLGMHWNGKTWERAINGEPMEIKHYANDVTGDENTLVSVGYWAVGNPKAGLAEFDNRTKKWKGYQFQTSGELWAVWTNSNGYFIAVGDNGMVYTKDGYNAEWEYSKIPTDFNMNRVTGTSKDEIYCVGHKFINMSVQDEVWRLKSGKWVRLFWSGDTTGNIIDLSPDQTVFDIAAYRCPYNDSLKIWTIGWESYLFEGYKNEDRYVRRNLTDMKLYLRIFSRSGLDINMFDPSDIWVFGTRYNFYHYNGSSFLLMNVPGLPNDQIQFGDQRKMIKTKSGKVFLPTEINHQVYVVMQGTP